MPEPGTNTAGEEIRISDLASPRLSPAQLQAIDYGNAQQVKFDEDTILAAARSQTGLDDFGASEFRERLRIWIRAVDEDTGLSPLGRLSLWNEMVRFAATRLRVEDLIRRQPKILTTEIETPLVIAGLPRSGTTYLLQILAGDRRLRSLPYWEAVRPVAESFIENGIDKRREICGTEWEEMDNLLPYIKSIHEFSPDHISEDVELQCIDFGSYYFEWLARVDRWRDYYYSHDQTSVYRYMRKMLQLLSWQRGPNRWVTKCPQHMEQLGAVQAALPGSTLVITHRDPLASIQSAITAVAYRARVMRTEINLQSIADYWIARYERLLQACVHDHDQLNKAGLHDVYFHLMMADPHATLEEIYQKSGIVMDDTARADLAKAIGANKRGKHGQLVYDMRGDFGLDPATIRKRFEFYHDRFPVRIEVK
jgi:hypothetical protein